MLDLADRVVVSIKERYNHLHPLILNRSLEKAETAVELFDILDSFPQLFPVIWNDKDRCWQTTDDLYQKCRID